MATHSTRRRRRQASGSLPEPLMTVAQVAGFLGVSEKTVYALALEGAIPSIKIGTRRRALLRFRREQLAKLGEPAADPAPAPTPAKPT